MGSPAAGPRLLYRSSRLLRAAFLQLHRQQQRADVFCDVLLQAEGQAVPAHCCVLSVCSPFFMERLAAELPPRGRRVVLELTGLKIGALRKLVDFLYTAELEASREEAQEVLAAARQLRVAELESLQLKGGRLVKPGPSWRLDRGCLRTPRPASPGGCGKPAGAPPQGQTPPVTKRAGCPGPVGPVKLRKAVSRGCWEVVQEERCPPGPRPAGLEPETPAGGDAEPRKPARVPPAARQSREPAGARDPLQRDPPQRDPPKGRGLPSQPKRGDPAGGGPPTGPGGAEAEEIDVGATEPRLPPGAVCVRPSPSSESDVDVLS
ncbi:BTB/POZ domain-containing protein 18 [Struthio camelus]|uniref:BTB/POZ domain-containing protein 18 n=1 Tax=Struthio camelus TaxID=8801 RepID=UPI003603C970